MRSFAAHSRPCTCTCTGKVHTRSLGGYRTTLIPTRDETGRNEHILTQWWWRCDDDDGDDRIIIVYVSPRCTRTLHRTRVYAVLECTWLDVCVCMCVYPRECTYRGRGECSQLMVTATRRCRHRYATGASRSVRQSRCPPKRDLHCGRAHVPSMYYVNDSLCACARAVLRVRTAFSFMYINTHTHSLAGVCVHREKYISTYCPCACVRFARAHSADN